MWWAADSGIEETVAPPTVRLWSALSHEEKNYYTVQGYIFFPEILGNSNKKYQRYALWLATNCGIVNTNIRDQFSAGGRVDIVTPKGVYERMPAAFGRIQRYKDLIVETLMSVNSEVLKEYWMMLELPDNRLLEWCSKVAIYAGATREEAIQCLKLLRSIFNI